MLSIEAKHPPALQGYRQPPVWQNQAAARNSSNNQLLPAVQATSPHLKLVRGLHLLHAHGRCMLRVAVEVHCAGQQGMAEGRR